MNSEDTLPEEITEPPQVTPEEKKAASAPVKEKSVINIAKIQRMNIDELNQFGRKIGLKHLGSLTKQQMVFDIVKAMAEHRMKNFMGKGS